MNEEVRLIVRACRMCGCTDIPIKVIKGKKISAKISGGVGILTLPEEAGEEEVVKAMLKLHRLRFGQTRFLKRRLEESYERSIQFLRSLEF